MIYLVLVIALLSGLLAFEKYQNSKERSKLINALISKKPEDMVALETADKIKPVKTKDPLDGFVSEDSLTQEELEEYIKKTNG